MQQETFEEFIATFFLFGLLIGFVIAGGLLC